MAKLFCSRVVNKPKYVEDMITEITEKVFIINGYDIADRMLEGLLFCVHFDDSGVTDITFEDKHDKKWFEENFNSKKFYKQVKEEAEGKLEEGDEVNVPKFIKDKYFKDGINVAFITNEI